MLTSLLAFAVLFSADPASVQTFGSLSGTVADPLGAILPDVPVVLIQPERQARYEIRTDRNGQYEFQGLSLGEYQLEAGAAGFATYRATVSITNAAVRIPISLRIGGIHETIRVTEAEAPAGPPRAALAYTEAPCPAPPTTTVGGNLRPPRKLRDVKPDYPATLRGSGRDATIVIDGRIGLDGFVKDIQPREPVDPAFFDVLVVAVREWRFSAILLNCVPQEADITITASFVHKPF